MEKKTCPLQIGPAVMVLVLTIIILLTMIRWALRLLTQVGHHHRQSLHDQSLAPLREKLRQPQHQQQQQQTNTDRKQESGVKLRRSQRLSNKNSSDDYP
jgi:hypothetical protein